MYCTLLTGTPVTGGLLLQRKGDNLLQKHEQEELQSVCEVMEDLIRMQSTIFTVSLAMETCLYKEHLHPRNTLLYWTLASKQYLSVEITQYCPYSTQHYWYFNEATFLLWANTLKRPTMWWLGVSLCGHTCSTKGLNDDLMWLPGRAHMSQCQHSHTCDSVIIHPCLYIVQIPAQLYDTALRQLSTSDPEALDQILKRRCYDQG